MNMEVNEFPGFILRAAKELNIVSSDSVQIHKQIKRCSNKLQFEDFINLFALIRQLGKTHLIIKNPGQDDVEIGANKSKFSFFLKIREKVIWYCAFGYCFEMAKKPSIVGHCCSREHDILSTSTLAKTIRTFFVVYNFAMDIIDLESYTNRVSSQNVMEKVAAMVHRPDITWTFVFGMGKAFTIKRASSKSVLVTPVGPCSGKLSSIFCTDCFKVSESKSNCSRCSTQWTKIPDLEMVDRVEQFGTDVGRLTSEQTSLVVTSMDSNYETEFDSDEAEFMVQFDRQANYRVFTELILTAQANGKSYKDADRTDPTQWENMLLMILKNKQDGVTINFADCEKINVSISHHGQLTFQHFNSEDSTASYFVECLSPGCWRDVFDHTEPKDNKDYASFFCYKHYKDEKETSWLPRLQWTAEN